MLFKKTLLAAAVFALGGVAFTATAATASDTFLVKINILASCSVTAGTASDIDFGNHVSSDTNMSASNTISVTCSNTTPYDIGLLPTATGATANGTGVMISSVAGNTDEVPFALWQDAGHGTVWGNTVGTNTLGGTGTGLPQISTVYASADSANFTPGAYQDTVTVTVTY